MLSHVWLFATPWAVARQAPLSIEFSHQEYQSEFPFPTPGDLPNPGIIPVSPILAGNFFFNFILFLNLTILYWFCQISKWIRHRYTWVPHPEPSSLLPPHSIPLGRPSAPAPSIQYRASFRIWYYTYFNAILPNHPTLSLSHRVQKTVLYISVCFAVSYTGLLLPSF